MEHLYRWLLEKCREITRKINLNQKTLYLLSVVIVTIFFSLPFLKFDKIVYAGDIFPFFLRPENFLHQMLSSYDDFTMNFGIGMYYFPQYIFITLTSLLLQVLGGYVFATKIIYIVYSALPFLVINLFCLEFFSKNKNKYIYSFFISVFFTFNLLNHDVFYNGYLTFRGPLILLPLIGYLFLRYIKFYNLNLLILIIVTSIFSFVNYAHPLMLVFATAYIPFLVFVLCMQYKTSFFTRKVLLFLVAFFIPIIFSYFVFFNDAIVVFNSHVNDEHNQSLTAIDIRMLSQVPFTTYLQFYPTILNATWGENPSGKGTEPIYQGSSDYYNNSMYILFSLTAFFLFVFLLIKSKKTKIILLISSAILLQLILLGLYRLLPVPFDITNIFVNIIRNIPNKLATFYTFTFCLFFLFTILSLEKIKHIKIYLFLLAIGFILFNRYVLTGDVIYRYQFVNVPQEYIKGADMINNDNSLENRTMIFPFNTASWLDLNWNFNGYDPFTYLISGPKISQSAVGFTRLDNRYFNGIIALLKKQNFVQLTKLLQNNSFKYFIYRKDLSFYRFPDKTTYLYKESNLYYHYLLKNKQLIPFFDNKYFAIYVLQDVKPRIYIKNVNTVATAHLVIPEFNIEIKNLRDKAVINFSDNYSQNWNLYIASNENIFFDSFGISSLWQKPIAENTHVYTQRNNFSNSWTIDRTDIEKNFPQSSYTINSDGSISVSLKLYYKPQFYFSLLMAGVIISYIVLAIFLFIHLKIFKNMMN